jgi:hypothetical protein
MLVARPTRNVLFKSLVLMDCVSTPATVDQMLTVEFQTTIQFVTASKVTLATHSLDVSKVLILKCNI